MKHLSRFVLVLVPLVAACDGGWPPAPTLDEPLTAQATAPATTIPLAPYRLETQADFDALEGSWKNRRALADLVDVYTALAEAADPAARPADALLLQRLAILLIRTRPTAAWVTLATRIADRLNRVAPNSPHTRYLDGFIKRVLLQATASERALIVSEYNKQAPEAVIADWSHLLAAAPAYDGPGDHDGAAIRADLEALAQGLAAFRAGAAAASAAAVVTARPATTGEAAALADLAAFEASADTSRRVLCRDRVGAERVGGPSAAEARIDALCALADGQTDEAVAALGRLLAAGADACALAPRVRATVVGPPDAPGRATLEADLKRLGLDRCPR